jgi:putative resolvase
MGSRWTGCARPHIRGHRRYDLAKFRPELFHAAEAPHRTIAYARVSSNDQKADLERQKQVLELFCATNGWQFEVISDLGSGMNYRKKGQKRLLDEIVDSKVGRLVTHTAHSFTSISLR